MLGLLCPEKAPHLPPIQPHLCCPLGIAADHLAAELAPGQEEKRILLPQPSLLPALPGASRPQFLQNEAAGPMSPPCPCGLSPQPSGLAPRRPGPSSPSPRCHSSACFFLASSSSPHTAAHGGSALHPALLRQALLPSAKVNTAPATRSAQSRC